MALHQYIGARYVPKFYENSLGTAEWVAGVIYEPLTIVTYNNNSYTSKKMVPASVGDPSSNPDYWVATGAYNQQISDLSSDVAALDLRVAAAENDIQDLQSDKKWYFPEDYGAAGDGITDDTAAIQNMFDSVPNNSIILFTAARYLITDTVIISKANLRISGICRSEYHPTLVTSKTSGTSLIINAPGVSVNDLLFEGPEMDVNGVILIELNGDNSVMGGNIDGEFRNCGFYKANIGVIVKGRNVRCTNCIFSTLAVGYRPEQTVLDTDNRGYVLTNNRFHSTKLCIGNNVSNTRPIKNFVIASNFADVVESFFNGYGGGVVITGNTISTAESIGTESVIVIKGDALNPSDIYNVIIGNVINGRLYSSGSNYMILADAAKVIIDGNVFQKFDGSAIAGNASSAAIVRNNVLNAVARQSNYVIQFASGASGIIKNNMISNCIHTSITATSMTVSDNDVLP